MCSASPSNQHTRPVDFRSVFFPPRDSDHTACVGAGVCLCVWWERLKVGTLGVEFFFPSRSQDLRSRRVPLAIYPGSPSKFCHKVAYVNSDRSTVSWNTFFGTNPTSSLHGFEDAFSKLPAPDDDEAGDPYEPWGCPSCGDRHVWVTPCFFWTNLDMISTPWARVEISEHELGSQNVDSQKRWIGRIRGWRSPKVLKVDLPRNPM